MQLVIATPNQEWFRGGEQRWNCYLQQGYHGVGGYALAVHGFVGLQGAGEGAPGGPGVQLGELRHIKNMCTSQQTQHFETADLFGGFWCASCVGRTLRPSGLQGARILWQKVRMNLAQSRSTRVGKWVMLLPLPALRGATHSSDSRQRRCHSKCDMPGAKAWKAGPSRLSLGPPDV